MLLFNLVSHTLFLLITTRRVDIYIEMNVPWLSVGIIPPSGWWETVQVR